MQLMAREMLFGVVHDLDHVVRCVRHQSGCVQGFSDIFLHIFFIDMFDSPVDDVPELLGKWTAGTRGRVSASF